MFISSKVRGKNAKVGLWISRTFDCNDSIATTLLIVTECEGKTGTIEGVFIVRSIHLFLQIQKKRKLQQSLTITRFA
jgi:hypothetical protein